MSQILMPPQMASQDAVLDKPFPAPTRLSRLLIVDNDHDTLESLQDFLQLCLPRVEVVSASSAREGLRMLATHSVDAVLCEFRLPGMNGVQFLKECRRIQPAAVRMLCTSFPTMVMAIQAVNEAKIDHLFRKPLEPTALTAVLTRALDATRSATTRQLAFSGVLRVLQDWPGLHVLPAPKTTLATTKLASAPKRVAL